MKESSRVFTTLQASLLRGLDRALDWVGAFSRRLDADELIDTARKRSGLDDFGEWAFDEPLRVLIDSYEREANLTPFGRLAARWDMTRCLTNLLRLRYEEQLHPAIALEPITKPLFIMGMPRSGTTFLHNLLRLDPSLRIPRCWETILPYPDRDLNGRPDRREQQIARQLVGFVRLAPELPRLHQLEANAAQECIEIMGQAMRSLRFDITHHVPSYDEWLDRTGHLEAYRFHKRFLQHLQYHRGRRQWVLKCPDHIFAFAALEETYPDARLVFVHREPIRVIASVAKLTEVLRRPFSRQVDRAQIGRQVIDRWVQGAHGLIEVSERFNTNDRLMHIRYGELTRDPLGSITRIYRHFGLNLDLSTEDRFRQAIAARPNGGYGNNSYRLDEFDLHPKEVKRQFQPYADYFGLESEAVNAPPARSMVKLGASPAPDLL